MILFSFVRIKTSFFIVVSKATNSNVQYYNVDFDTAMSRLKFVQTFSYL